MAVSRKRQDAERADALRATQKAAEGLVRRNAIGPRPTVCLFLGTASGSAWRPEAVPLSNGSGVTPPSRPRGLLRPSATAAPAALRVLRPAVPIDQRCVQGCPKLG